MSNSEGQKRKLAKAYRDNEEVSVRLSKDSLSGSDSLFVPKRPVNKINKNASNGRGTEVTISKANIRKQTGSGGPKIRKIGRGDPKIGPWNPPPFIGKWGGKQYGRGWLDMVDPLNSVEEWFVDTVQKNSRGRGQKGEGADWIKYILGSKNMMLA